MVRCPCRVSLALLVVALAAARSEPLRAAGIDGVLLLRNGNLLEGRIARSGDRYEVASRGALLKVPERQVQSFHPTKAAAYVAVRGRVTHFDADVHLALAKWCLRHDLEPQASVELEAAERLNPDHRLLPGLRRQVAANSSPPRAGQATEILQASWDGELVEPGSPTDGGGSTDESSAIPQSIGLPGKEQSPTWTRSGPTIQLTDATRAQFVRSIQPMLLHSCTATGCHQTGSKHGLQLDRLAITAGSHPAVFERNLEALLRQLRDGPPSESPLVRMANREHGSDASLSKPLRPHQAALLAEWVATATGFSVDQAPPSQDAPPGIAAASEAGVVAVEAADKPEVGGETAPRNAGIPDAAAEPTFEEIESLDWGASDVQVGASAEAVAHAPRDPFDPEVFNRLYGTVGRRTSD